MDLVLLQMPDNQPCDPEEEQETAPGVPPGSVFCGEGLDGFHDEVVQNVGGQCVGSQRAEQGNIQV